MKKLCPNLAREDGLQTVLEVPIPEEIFTIKSGTSRAWHNMKSWMKPNVESSTSSSLFGDQNTDIQLLLGVVGAPLIPLPVTSHDQPITIKSHNIEASMAKYIVKQYVAAVGGESALNWVESMYAVGEVRVGTTEFSGSEECVSKKKMVKVKKMQKKGEVGGFVVWQKKPELWCLELVVSGQRTGLLVQLEDSHLLKLKTTANDAIFWETNMESLIQDYKTVDGINIAHAGKTWVTLSRFGEGPESHSKTRVKEVWKIEEVDFNIKGLSIDCFLPPSDLKKEEEKVVEDCRMAASNTKLPYKIQSASFKISVSKVAAVNVDDSSGSESDGDEEDM
ncbi:uncharacterized protein HKW66_Vig0129920 [Vigna angularis]|uniref:Uncharacterized protein n=1 Tax=Phaseolus angularis TaxID=3914 RepID=A0A8T0K2B5_PHAAN|nr:uncharacterized protein HKW66_Vig0129920 [Vigna angularis]